MVACRPWTGISRLPLCEVFEVAQPSGSVRVVYRLWFDMTTRPQAFATTCGASARCGCAGQCATSPTFRGLVQTVEMRRHMESVSRVREVRQAEEVMSRTCNCIIDGRFEAVWGKHMRERRSARDAANHGLILPSSPPSLPQRPPSALLLCMGERCIIYLLAEIS